MRIALAIVMATFTLGLSSRPTTALQARDDVSPLEFIQMIDAQVEWAATARCGPCPPHVVSGAMLRTTSGGTQWKDVTPIDSSGQKIDVPYFYAFNSQIAWAVKTSMAATTEIFRTIDGGRAWKSITIPAPSVSSISFINPREGWLIAFLSAATGRQAVEIFRSSDGGETWIKVAASEQGGGLPLYGGKDTVTFLNSTTGWITVYDIQSDLQNLYVTRDGGHTWRRQSLSLPPWRQQSSPLPPQVTPRWIARPRPPKFFTPRDGIVRVDYAHSLFDNSTGDEQGTEVLLVHYATRDGGTTWTATTPVSVREIDDRRPGSFADMSHGWVREGGTLYVTSSGGRRWTTIRPGPLVADVTQLDFISSRVGWAVRNTHPHSGGAIQTFPFLLKTVDGGRTWIPVAYTILR